MVHQVFAGTLNDFQQQSREANDRLKTIQRKQYDEDVRNAVAYGQLRAVNSRVGEFKADIKKIQRESKDFCPTWFASIFWVHV